MEILDKKYVDNNREKIINAIKDGRIFIYPTDTIYGIGTNAMNEGSVRKIREIKQRESKPLSIIAPGIEWIRENCELSARAEIWISKLPGPYTIFLDVKNKNCVSKEINPVDDSIGVRIPKHWFVDIIKGANVPFITTSVNISGQPYMRKIEDLDENIKRSVNYIIYEGEINGKESQKIDLRKLEKRDKK